MTDHEQAETRERAALDALRAWSEDHPCLHLVKCPSYDQAIAVLAAAPPAEGRAARVREIPSIALSGQVDNDFLDDHAAARREAEDEPAPFTEPLGEPRTHQQLAESFKRHQSERAVVTTAQEFYRLREDLEHTDDALTDEQIEACNAAYDALGAALARLDSGRAETIITNEEEN